MKVRSKVLQFLHLDSTYSLLSARCINIALEFFKAFDIHKNQGLNGKCRSNSPVVDHVDIRNITLVNDFKVVT